MLGSSEIQRLHRGRSQSRRPQGTSPARCCCGCCCCLLGCAQRLRLAAGGGASGDGTACCCCSFATAPLPDPAPGLQEVTCRQGVPRLTQLLVAATAGCVCSCLVPSCNTHDTTTPPWRPGADTSEPRVSQDITQPALPLVWQHCLPTLRAALQHSHTQQAPSVCPGCHSGSLIAA